jgi:hypothetical protein
MNHKLLIAVAVPLGAFAWASAANASVACQSETPAGTFSPIYTCLNGTTTLPGTAVGTIGGAAGDVIQIGSISLYNSGSGGAFINPSNNPSIYQFIWTGGLLDITEALGNNGTEGSIDVELGAEPGLTLNANGSLSSALASINIPFSSGPSGFFTVYDAALPAGTYVLDTYAGALSIDPNYQQNFSGVGFGVPEPSSLAILGTTLFGLGLLGLVSTSRRRRYS